MSETQETSGGRTPSPGPPAEIGRCEIVAVLGEGGMGVVYRARHRDLDLDVAVKLLRPYLVRQGENAERFLREARLAARLNHPAIVRVFDCGCDLEHHYIVMEYVEGQSLEAHIRERGALPVPRALQIAETVASALGEALEQIGAIHRDIKPANLLLTRSGQIKVSDFGLAKVMADEQVTQAVTAAGVALGTPRYMSPEQFADAGRVDHRADMFSLGATLYHMLRGQPPFAGNSVLALLRQVCEEEPEPLPGHVPLEVVDLVDRMLAKRPEDRFSTYHELVAALREAQRSLGASDEQVMQTIAAATVGTSAPTIQVAPRTLRPASPTENRILLVVDIQNDFCPGGALAVPEGDAVVPVINRLARRFAHVILTQDWHGEDHLSFASSHPGRKPLEKIEFTYGTQILWPDHCVQGTRGAEFHPELSIPHAELIIRKGYHREIDSYSAFFENDRRTPTGLAGYLRERGLTRIFLVGLATDFCVAYSALDASRLGFEVTVIEEACRGIDVEGSLEDAWRHMEEAGIGRV
jgi:eukaryotic-like serine/threonine-protein kinase